MSDNMNPNQAPQEGGVRLSPEKLAEMSKFADENFDTQQFQGDVAAFHEDMDPLGENPYLEQESDTDIEFDQGVIYDALSGVYNSLIMDGGEGLANLIPTVSDAVGIESEFMDDWSEGVTNWFDAQRVMYSDDYYKPIEGFSDLNSSHWAAGLGNGLGFIMGIMGGSGIAGGVSKGSKALKVLNKAKGAEKIVSNSKLVKKAQKMSKFMDKVKDPNMRKLGAKMVARHAKQAEKSIEKASRLGSFITGTTMMYPSVLKEAKEAGLDNGEAARFALGVSGLVSLTEGAALEWIGKIPSRAVTKKLTSGAVSKTLKNAGSKNAIDLQKTFLKNMRGKASTRLANVAEGSAVEFGQEFSQTYIEEGAKKMYDSFIADTEDTKGKGKFGAEINYETFVQATFGGMLGALLGGGMTQIGSQITNERDLAKETLFSYVNNATKKGDKESMEKLNSLIDESIENGAIDQETGNSAKETIMDMEKYSRDFQVSGNLDGTTNFQLFTLDKTKRQVESKKSGLEVSEDANEAIKSEMQNKSNLIDKVSMKVQENFLEVLKDGKDEAGAQDFQDRMAGFDLVAEGIINNVYKTEEEVDKALSDVFTNKTDKEAKKQERKKKKEEKAQGTKEEAVTEFKGEKGFTYTNENIQMAEEIASMSMDDFGNGNDVKLAEKLGITEEELGKVYEQVSPKEVETAKSKLTSVEQKETEEAPPGTEEKENVPQSLFEEVDEATTPIEKNPYNDLTEAEIDQEIQNIEDYRNLEGTQHNEMDKAEMSFLKQAKNNKNKPDSTPPKKEIRTRKSFEEEAKKKEGRNEESLQESVAWSDSVMSNPQAYSKQAYERAKAIRDANKKFKIEPKKKTEDNQSLDERIAEIKKEREERIIAYAVKKYPKVSPRQARMSVYQDEEVQAMIREADVEIEALKDAKRDEDKPLRTIEGLNQNEKEVAEKYHQDFIDIANKINEGEQLTESEENLRDNYPAILAGALELVNEIEETESQEQQESSEEADTSEQTEEVNEEEVLKQEKENDDEMMGNSEVKINLKDLVDVDLAGANGQTNQLASVTREARQISKNTALFEKIKNHFSKIFPNISVEQVNKMFDKYGSEVLARVTERGIQITEGALQDSLIHEYAHVYLDMIADSGIKEQALDWIKGTEYFTRAQKAYANYSVEQQAEEALAQAMAEDSFAKLEKKLSGSKIEQFIELAKKLWRTIKRRFVGVKGKDLVSFLSDQMTFSNQSFSANTAYVGMSSKNQLAKMVDPHTAQVSNAVQNAVASLRIQVFRKGLKGGMITQDTLKPFVYSQIGHLVEGVNAEKLNEAKDINERYKLVEESMDKFDADLVNSMIEKLSKIPLLSTNNEADAIAEALDGKSDSKVEIKGNQRISLSVRSIMSALVNPSGEIIHSDNIWQYLGSASAKSWTNKAFMKKLADDAVNNDVANSINSLLNHIKALDDSYDSNMLNSFLSEINSIVAIPYRSTLIETKDGKMKITLKDMNPSKIATGQFSELKERIVRIGKNYKFSTSSQGKVGLIGFLGRNNNGRNFTYNGMKSVDVDQAYNEMLDFYGIDQSIDVDELYDIISKKDRNSTDKYKGKEFIVFKLMDYAFRTNAKEENSKFEYDAKGYIENMYKSIGKIEGVSNMFYTSNGNSVSSIRYSYWLDRSLKLLKKPSVLSKYLNSPVFKNNHLLAQNSAQPNGIEWYIHDAINNMDISNISEHGDQNFNDMMFNQLANYANLYGGKYGQQMFINDRSHTTYAKVDRLDSAKLTHALSMQAMKDESILNEQIAKIGEEQQKQFIEEFNKISYNQAEIKDGKVVVYPMTYNESATENALIKAKREYINGKIAKHVKFINDFKLSESLLSDIRRQNGKENYTVEQLAKDFILNDHVNRQALTDILEGPMAKRLLVKKYTLDKKTGEFKYIHKVDPANIVKRASGIDSGGKLGQLDKPVKFIVYRRLDQKEGVAQTEGVEPVSNSFSFNGKGLTNKMTELFGDFDKQGHSVKDMIYQVDENGNLLYIKNSGLNYDEKADNLRQMDGESKGNYSAMADIIDALEAQYGEDHYIKVVDEDTLKGDFKHETSLTIEEMTQMVNDGKVGDIDSKAGFTENVYNYQQPFNLHKDVSKNKLEEQSVVASTQALKIVLNQASEETAKAVEEVESLMVEMSKEKMQFGQTTSKNADKQKKYAEANPNDYTKSKFYEAIKKTNTLLKSLSQSTDQLNSPDLYELLNDLQSYNKLRGEGLDQARKTKKKILEKYNNQVEKIEGKDLNDYNNAVNVLEGKDTISKLDHPELLTKIQQLISSRIYDKAIRTEIPGQYLQMAPDLNHGTSQALASDEALVPWSMFGETREQAEAFLEEMNKKGGIPLSGVRVPASGAVSTFNVKVKGFVNGNSNTTILPHEFTLLSDADHDGDKVFLYRNDLKTTEDGRTEIVESNKNRLFEAVNRLNNSKEMQNQRAEGGLSLAPLKAQAEELGLGMDYRFSSPDELADLASRLSFGGSSIGIFAVAGKMTSMLSQSNASLKDSFEVTIDGKKHKLYEFSKDNLNDVAVLLQAALDITKDPTLLMTGVNPVTVNVATAMSMLGIQTNDIMKYLNEPAIKRLVSSMGKGQNSFTQENPEYIKGQIKSLMESEKITSRSKQVLEDYEKLMIVASSINDLVNIVQLDGGLPGNTTKLDKVVQSYEKMNEEKGALNLGSFPNRPLIKHYGAVLELAKDVYGQHFLTESDTFKSVVNKLESTLSNKNVFVNKEKLDRSTRDMFMSMVAQGLVSPEVYEEIGSVGIDNWISDFVQSISDNIDARWNQNISPSEQYAETTNKSDYEATSNFDYKGKTYNLYELSNDNPQKYDQIMAEMDEVEKSLFESEVNRYNNFVSTRESISENDLDNYFLGLLRVVKKGDEDVLSGAKDIRYLTQEEKRKAKDAFAELDNNLQEQFKAFQLLKYGLSNKIGSIISIMPESFSKDYLIEMSKLKNSPSVMENMALDLNYVMSNKSAVWTYNKFDKNGKEVKRNPFQTVLKDGDTYLGYTDNETGEVVTYGFKEDMYVRDRETGKVYYVAGKDTSHEGRVSQIKSNFSQSKNHTLYDSQAELVSGKEVFKQVQESKEALKGC